MCFRRLRKAIASWSSLVSNWTLIGRTFGFYLRWWVLAFSWCNLWFSIRFWGRTAFKWRRFLLNSPPGVCTVYDLVATTSPDSSWCVTHTYSPGDKTGNSLAPQWVSWFTFCLLFSFLSLVATSEMFGVLGFLWSSIMGTVVHNFLLINNSEGLYPISNGVDRYANKARYGSPFFNRFLIASQLSHSLVGV